MTVDPVAALLSPASIGIVGLSADPGKHGSRVLANLRKLGYPGNIYGGNPRGDVIDGIQTTPSVLDWPSAPEVVVAAVPASGVIETIRQAGQLGSRVVVLFGGGFAEAGPEGKRTQQRLADSARRAGVRLLGPNSGGVISPGSRVALSFLTCLDRPADQIRSGPVAVVTQSGGTGSYLHNLAAAAGSGLAASVSTGNEADITIADAIEALSRAEGVGSIAVVAETIRDGRRFLEAVRAAHRAGRPVVLCRLGRSARGRELMLSHTGALATEDRVLDGVCDALGITSAATPGELLDLAQIAAHTTLPAGPRVGVVTHSGGIAILCSDLGSEEQIVLPKPPESAAIRLRPLLQYGAVSNPLDLGAIIGGPHRFAESVREFQECGSYDLVLAVTTPHPPSHTAERASGLVTLAAADRTVPIVNLWMAGDLGAEGLALLRRAGAAVTEEPRAALRAIGALVRFAGQRGELLSAEPADPSPAGEVWLRATAGVPRPAPGGSLSEHSAKQWLREIGLPVVGGVRARTVADACTAAEQLGYPVVVKANAADLPHKSRVGAVRIGARDRDEVAAAFEDVCEAVATRVPAAVGDGVLVERFCPGTELMVGCIVNRSFGPVVAVGSGGRNAELEAQVSISPAPVSHRQAGRMLMRLPVVAAPERASDQGLPDIDALAEIVSKLSRQFVALLDHIQELEVNPITWNGTGWQVLDALVRPRVPRRISHRLAG